MKNFMINDVLKQDMLDILPVAVLIIDRESGELEFANRAAHDLSGGQYPQDLPDDKSECFATDADGKKIPFYDLPRFRAARGEVIRGYEMTWHHPGGEIPVVVHTCSVQKKVILVFQEIYERKKREDIQKQFISSLSHDLRTPLTGARMGVELLMRDLPESQHSKLSRVLQNIDRVDQMIRDLLDANRIQSGEDLSLEMKPNHLNWIIKEVLQNLSMIYGPRFHFLELQDIHGVWCKKSLFRMLENLLLNAYKYGHENAPITIKASEVDGHVCIGVHNIGNPIPEADRHRLFHQFQRLDPVHNNNQNGWGLGLALVKWLAEAHNGFVDVHSNKLEGTTFEIHIPLDSNHSFLRIDEVDRVHAQTIH
jgi:signal transduction histidine kinase